MKKLTIFISAGTALIVAGWVIREWNRPAPEIVPFQSATLSNHHSTLLPTRIRAPEIQVQVSGAVARPGE
ncbi:hypothetical protein EBR96_10230, partial [bacterium]|nr:hypothetical protein [bacterium]